MSGVKQQNFLEVASLETAHMDLRLIAGTIDRCWKSALEEYPREYATLRHRHSARTRSSIIHDLMISHIKLAFDGSTIAIGRHIRNTYELTVNNRYKFRFKKLNPKYQASNIPTQTVLEFKGQLQLPTLALTNLFVGYQVDKDAIDLSNSRRYIVCPSGSSYHWLWEITDIGNEGSGVELLIANDQTSITARVKIRQSAKQDVTITTTGDTGAVDDAVNN